MGDSFVSYLRVSTFKQGSAGLGIEAQRAAVASYLAGFGAEPIAEFVEVESGKRTDRPELARALSDRASFQATRGSIFPSIKIREGSKARGLRSFSRLLLSGCVW